MARRGLDFVIPRLYVLDGAKALSVAVKLTVCPKTAGFAAEPSTVVVLALVAV